MSSDLPEDELVALLNRMPSDPLRQAAALIDRLRADNARLVGEVESIMTRFRELVITNEKHYNDVIRHKDALVAARVAFEKMRIPLETIEDIDKWFSDCDKALTTINEVLGCDK